MLKTFRKILHNNLIGSQGKAKKDKKVQYFKVKKKYQ